ncbi:MAG: radical SAM protein, partial [Desulfobacterales bacterium]|nr:radical SAM protein [Desulfobacterales bacterium]
LESGDPKASWQFDQIESLDTLPAPDYDDYFAQLRRLEPAKRFFPVVPVEISRGCWWQKRLKSGGRGCAFCNLNTQWSGYRSKNPVRVISELDSLKRRYRLMNFAFMDNALPVKASYEIFEELAATGHDFSFFGEIRAATSLDTLVAMRQAGLDRVQIGIEALSSRMLKKLNKGTTAIENLEVMKHCEELGIVNRSNLILQFPGSDDADVVQTLRTLEFAAVYRPLKPVRFWLGLGSPVCRSGAAFGIQTHFNHPHYLALFPRDICRKVPLAIRAYRGDRVKQKKLWRPVVRRIRQWETDYAALMSQNPAMPVLSYRDGGDFIIIRHREAAGRTHSHRLTGTSRGIYLFCRQQRTLKSIASRHAGFSQQQIKDFLDDMVRQKLMFTESGRYLSLAVRMSSSTAGRARR